MPLKASCLMYDTELYNSLKGVVEYTGYKRISKGLDANIGSIYNEIRKAGIEVDLQTVGYLYNEVLPKEFKQINSDEQVNEYVLKNYKDAINRAVKLEDKEGVQQIGQDAPEQHVVNGLLNMFTNANTSDNRTKSDMLTMQNALWKGIQRKLNLPDNQKPKTQEQWKDTINKALGYEELGIRDVNGKLNGISSLFQAMQEQLKEAGKELIRKGDYADVARWYDMVDALESEAYSLLFSKGEAKDVLQGIMKDAGFAKTLKNGKTILDWNKLAGEIGNVQQLRSNVQRVLEDNGFNADVIEGIKNSLVNEFEDLQADILEHADKELTKRENAIDRDVNSKTDLKRLAELNNLGIFQSSHDRLLHNLIGVSDLQQQDIADLKELAQAASDLYRHIDKNYGNDIYGSSALQTLQRSIDSIISRNINNKTRLNKIIAGIKNFFDVYLTGLLIAPFTILENFYSGVKEIVAPLISGQRGLSKEDLNVWTNMLLDVSKRGQAFGEEVGSFAPRELYSNTLKFKWKDASLKEKAESVLHVLMMPARIGLLGLDSANKVVITNKTFHNAIYHALKQKGMSHEDAMKTMNEALHGQSFAQAKVQAQSIIEKTNETLSDKFKIPVNNATVTRLANDLVKANLNLNGLIDNDLIEAALKSSYHVAGLGLGHEPNNKLSQRIKAGRNLDAKEEQRLIKEKKWDELAITRFKNTFWNSLVTKFMGGASNWIYLRFQSGFGVGIATGLLGAWDKDIDFKSKDTLEQSIKDIQNARNKIGRGITGISVTAMSYLIGFLLYGGGEDDETKSQRLAKLQELEKNGYLTKYQKDNLSSEKKADIKGKLQAEQKQLETDLNVFKKIKSNYEGSKLFRKVAPDVMLIQYYLNTDKNALLAALDYVQNQAGLGSQYSNSSKIQDAAELAYKGDSDAAQGELASIAGDSFGVPLWRGYKEWGRLAKWIGGGDVSSNYKQPTEFSEGLWGGGMLEDLGFYKRDSKITNLPGIGGASYEKFKAKGIETMTDLKEHPNWWNEKYKNGEGNTVYILDATSRKKAKEAADKWFEQN